MMMNLFEEEIEPIKEDKTLKLRGVSEVVPDESNPKSQLILQISPCSIEGLSSLHFTIGVTPRTFLMAEVMPSSGYSTVSEGVGGTAFLNAGTRGARPKLGAEADSPTGRLRLRRSPLPVASAGHLRRSPPHLDLQSATLIDLVLCWVVKRIGQVAYQLRLPVDSRVHDVFHVCLLKEFKGDPPASLAHLPPAEEGRCVLSPRGVAGGILPLKELSASPKCVSNLMRNNSTNDVSTKVEVLKLRQVPNLWRDVETSEAGKRSKIEVVKSTREISIRKIDLRNSSTSIADNAPPITKEPYLLKVPNLMRNNSTQIVAIKVEVLKLSPQVPNLMRNNSTNEVYTKVEALKLRQVPNLWRLDSDHESSGKENPSNTDRPLFHLRRASASVVVDAIVSNAKKQGITRKMMSGA
nr:uncharacterized protein LOC109115595 [Ipomoea trifida]